MRADPDIHISRFSRFLSNKKVICGASSTQPINRYGSSQKNTLESLGDHPRTRKWLITMVSKSPKDRVVPLPNGLNCL